MESFALDLLCVRCVVFRWLFAPFVWQVGVVGSVGLILLFLGTVVGIMAMLVAIITLNILLGLSVGGIGSTVHF